MSINIPVTAVSIAFRTYTKEQGLNAAYLVTTLLQEADVKSLSGIVPLSYNTKQYSIALKEEGMNALNALYGKSIYPKHVIVTELIQRYLLSNGVSNG